MKSSSSGNPDGSLEGDKKIAQKPSRQAGDKNVAGNEDSPESTGNRQPRSDLNWDGVKMVGTKQLFVIPIE